MGFLISAFFLYLALQGLRLGEVWLRLREANYRWLIPGVLVYFVGVWARTWRWHYMLRSVKIISLKSLFPVVVIGYMGNNVYPARAGEVIRSYVLRRREQVPMSSSLATILVERVFDGLVMLLFVFTSLPMTPMPFWLKRIVILASLLFIGALALFLGLAAVPRRAQAVASWLIERLLPSSVRELAEGIVNRFLAGLSFLRSGRDVGLVFAISLLIWLAETIKYWCVMQGFPFRVPFYVLMLMNGVVNLATTIPSSPGYVGTFDAPGIRVLEEFEVPREIAASYTLVLHAALWLPITCLGFYYMWRESISWRDFGAASELLS
ncbi:MAG: lysylphosphatidylglycerol synthase transmembrane domain-containing protein [Chloroflexota bacterium]|nr:lysylphosphatidylglycerol synthase transmembrane domain-containing protein [Chloroflexota bacterium]